MIQAHVPVLREALRAPSAHNAQPWRIIPAASKPSSLTATYQLHYDHNDYLPYDPDDRDAYLCMGTLLETLSLAGVRHGYRAHVEDVFTRTDSDLHIADVTLTPAEPETFDRPIDGELALAGWAADRHTNRSMYTREPLPASLRDHHTGEMSRLAARASALSWRDRRFVADLARFMHAEDDAPRGMTPSGLMLARYEWLLLRAAFGLGRLPGPLGTLYSGRDIRLLRTAPAVAVLGADSLAPRDLVAAGRRLLRVWALICGSGWAYHPISVTVDRPETVGRVAELSGIAVPAAVFRIGRPAQSAPRSNRVELTDVLPRPGHRSESGVHSLHR
jgi:hypothetical protein